MLMATLLAGCCRHADLLAHDQEVSSLFSRHCQVGWDEQQKR